MHKPILPVTPSTHRAKAVILAAGIAGLFLAPQAFSQGLIPGDLLVSGSFYDAAPATIVPGTTVLAGKNAGTTVFATNDASYPNVFNNEGADAAFGITTPIFLQEQNTTSNAIDRVINVPTGSLVTSFSSKSELALNLSPDGQTITFMGYNAPDSTIDVSNTNTPGLNDPSNPVTQSPFNAYARTIGQIDVGTGTITTTPTNAYSGNNGRAAIYANGNYYIVGNAGNSGKTPAPTATTLDALSANSGVQMLSPGATQTGNAFNTTVVGAFTNTSTGNATGDQYGFSIAQAGFAADKTGKDDNFRGETIGPDGSLYVSKGSGSNGINTVYKVSVPGGGLPTTANASQATIGILPGFSATAATNGKNADGSTGTVYHPFGLWFANATTLYVADEGGGALTDVSNEALNTGGLQKWSFNSGLNKWVLDYTLTNNLLTGAVITPAANPVSGATYPTGTNAATGAPWDIYADGLRNITGKVNADGTVTIFGVTSTVSGDTDQGADPNQVVSITDTLTDTTLTDAASEQFNVVDGATTGEVYRGVTVVPEPTTPLLLLAGAGLLANRRRKR